MTVLRAKAGADPVASAAEPPDPVGFARPEAWIAYIIVAVAAVAGWLIYEQADPGVFTPAPGIGLFAVLYVVAQALERFLEPFAPIAARTGAPDLPTPETGGGRKITRTTAETIRDVAKANADVASSADLTQASLNTAARAQAAVDRARRNTALWLWVAATSIALLVGGWIGLRLLNAVGLKDVPVFFDILVTGLAIGAGTKPLHDLISNIEKAKEKKEDSATA